MSRSRGTARSKPKAPTPPKPPAEPSAPMKEDDPSEPPVNYRRLGINLALFLILSLEAGLVWLARPIWVTRLIVIATLVSTIWGVVASFVVGWVFALFRKKWEPGQRAFLQNRRLTLWLAGLALLGFVPAVLAAPSVFWPPPLLRVVPGNGVFNSVAQAVPGTGALYILRIEQDGEVLGTGDVTGAGSIYVGRNPKAQLTGIDEALADKQKAAMKDYLDVAADVDNKVVDKWMDADSNRFVKAPLVKGCIELVLLYHADAGEELIRQRVKVGSKVQLVYLEDKHESCPR